MKYILHYMASASAVLMLAVSPLGAQKTSPEAYIARFSGIAVEEMKEFGIPASITLAQGGLESNWGNSELALRANNHFGIKCHAWDGATYRKDAEVRNECFRKYSSPEESYRDHSRFLRYRDRYAFLFNLKITDYRGWAEGLQSAGYATDPKYASLLIQIIARYGLDKYDTPTAAVRKEKVCDAESGTVNGLKVIVAREGDTYASIAREYSIYKADLLRYNDVRQRSSDPKPGQKVYLERKKRKAQRHRDIHIASEGDTWLGISQQYGVRLKCICRYNGAAAGVEPSPGDTVYLRKKKRK